MTPAAASKNNKKRPGGTSGVIAGLPWVTLSVIATNVVVAVMATGNVKDIIIDYALVPSHVRVGRMLTANFVHDGYVHLAINMAILYIFGREVERVMGRLEFGMFYLGACFAASILHVAIVLATLPQPFEDRPMIGASGAVAGVLGIYAVRFHRRTFRIGGTEAPALLLIGGWLVLQLGLGIAGLYKDSVAGLGLKQVGYWSHLGGFAFGIIVALAANMALHGEREHLLTEAGRHYEEGNLLEATQHYEALLKYDPENAFAHAELGRLWAILEEEDQSLPYYHAAVALYIAQGQEERAIARAEEMDKFWPNAALGPPVRFRLASYLEEAGQPERAVRAFLEIADHCAEGVEAQMALLKVGQLQLSALSDAASATQTLEDFLTRYPGSEWRRFAEETLTRARSAGSTG